jgi:hypothetical protein
MCKFPANRFCLAEMLASALNARLSPDSDWGQGPQMSD